jgi:hypothetical protein
MTKDIALTLNDFVNAIDNSVKGSYDALTQKTFSCNTKWARIGKKVTNSLNKLYTITDISIDEWVKAIPDVSADGPLDGVFFLDEPYFVTGTKLAANREWTIADDNVMDKTPLVWLLETIRMTTFGRQSSLEFSTELRVFFLDETDIVNYYTLDHRTNVVQPMNKLINEFIQVVENTTGVLPLEETQRFTFSRFGVEKDNGVFQNVLDANLSGVELRFTLTKYKSNFCKTLC